MKKFLKLFVLGLAALVIGAGLLVAQDPVVGSSDPESLFTSKDPKLNTNKQAAMHIMRDLLEAGHWDQAPNWLTEKYIQHNPCCANGRQTVMTFFGGRGTPRPIPNKNNWATKVVSVVAEGDYVIVHGRFSNTGRPRNWIAADVVRVADDVLAEHWDVLQDEATEAESQSGLPMFGTKFLG